MSDVRSRVLAAPLALVLVALLAGCIDLAVNPDGETGRLSLSFRLAEADASAATAQAGNLSASASVDPALSTTITDSTGAVLVLHDVRLVVGSFAVERELGGCDGTDTSTCEPFVAEPHLLQVSLGELQAGEEIRVSEPVPADTYRALDFVVQSPGADLLGSIREQGAEVASSRPDRPKLAFDDWPEGASVFVSGTFDEDGTAGEAAPVPFRIFFQGEAGGRVEFPEDLPLVIRGGETTEAAVVMSRDAWRTSGDGQLVDLSQLDYDETGEVYTLDPALTEGFDLIEIRS